MMTRDKQVLVVAALALIAADLWWLYSDDSNTDDPTDAAEDLASDGESNGRPAPPRSARHESISPWEATPDNSPELAEGHTPAWDVEVPRPAQAPTPPVPRPPPDPVSNRPSMHSVNGVNGDRPPR